MRMTRLAWALTVVCSLVVLRSEAQATGCQSEIDRLCKGEQRILECLRKNQKDLSPGCSTYLGVFEKMPSCIADAQKLCPTENPSASSVVGCLRGNQDKLSAACRDEIAQVR